jgi:hypothetical protein
MTLVRSLAALGAVVVLTFGVLARAAASLETR